MTKRGATIRDVARRAGVSVATVSYVLNGRNAVAEDTRTRVVEAMRELAYYPSAAARSLARRSSGMIGFLIPHRPEGVFLDPYFAELILGVAIMADAHQYNPVIVAVEGEAHAHEVYARIVQNDLVDGLVISFLSEQHTYLLEEMQSDGVPFVVVGSTGTQNATFVDVDNRGGAEQAVNYLVSLGHRVIGFINGRDEYPHARQRLAGFQAALRAHAIPPESCPVINTIFSREGGYGAMAQLLAREVRPSAVFAASDLMAVGAMQCLHEHGLEIPEDLSLVGFDDTLLAIATYPTLTTVRQPIRALGEAAVDVLYKKIHHLPAQSSIILPTELIVRDSARPLGTMDV